MPQSSTIAFYLIAGFLIYVIAKGELPVYLSVFLGPQPANQPSPSDANPTSGNVTLPSVDTTATSIFQSLGQ